MGGLYLNQHLFAVPELNQEVREVSVRLSVSLADVRDTKLLAAPSNDVWVEITPTHDVVFPKRSEYDIRRIAFVLSSVLWLIFSGVCHQVRAKSVK